MQHGYCFQLVEERGNRDTSQRRGSSPIEPSRKGRMYFGAQEGLYAINGDKELVPLGDLDEGVPSSMVTGRIDISPDGNHLLTAGPHGACLFDGQTWTRLFSAYDFR